MTLVVVLFMVSAGFAAGLGTFMYCADVHHRTRLESCRRQFGKFVSRRKLREGEPPRGSRCARCGATEVDIARTRWPGDYRLRYQLDHDGERIVVCGHCRSPSFDHDVMRKIEELS